MAVTNRIKILITEVSLSDVVKCEEDSEARGRGTLDDPWPFLCCQNKNQIRLVRKITNVQFTLITTDMSSPSSNGTRPDRLLPELVGDSRSTRISKLV